uniref:hypothetical protein n=1 Tax=Chroococcidiopsis sp. TS-821 TaxID=1378066 RepID=UPI001AEF7E3B|nr:hypothetical protein [Chroococcidiopsis sp. TS-821]
MALQPNQNHILIVEDDQGRKEFNLDAPVYSLGRDPRAIFVYFRSLFLVVTQR